MDQDGHRGPDVNAVELSSPDEYPTPIPVPVRERGPRVQRRTIAIIAVLVFVLLVACCGVSALATRWMGSFLAENGAGLGTELKEDIAPEYPDYVILGANRVDSGHASVFLEHRHVPFQLYVPAYRRATDGKWFAQEVCISSSGIKQEWKSFPAFFRKQFGEVRVWSIEVASDESGVFVGPDIWTVRYFELEDGEVNGEEKLATVFWDSGSESWSAK